MNRRLAAAAAVVLVVVAAAGYAARRLWLKSEDLLQPAIILRDANAPKLVQPPLAVRVGAVLHRDGEAAPRQKLIALTFDDGPYPVTTPLLLQTLADLRVPATFFLIGRDAQQFPALAQAIRAGGNEIADHTLTHPNLDQLASPQVTEELRQGEATLRAIAPDPSESRLFRPPHGRYTLATILAAQGAGFDTILWTDDPGDWRSVSAADLRKHVLAHATAPEIVLLHSGRPATIAMLPEVVARYRQAGYSFVTVGRLLQRVSAAELNRPAKLPLAAQ